MSPKAPPPAGIARGARFVAPLNGGQRVGGEPAPRSVEPPGPQIVGPAQRVEVCFRLAGHVLGIVAVLALSFLAEVAVLGNLQHDRDQIRLAEEFRGELAEGTAPVGPRDDDLKLLVPGSPVAIVEIPKLKLREVVVEGTSSATLMSGPGHRRDTPLPGQVGTSVIAGRRATYGGPFAAINQLKAGDVIMVTTGQGRSSFTVSGLRRSGDPLPPTPGADQGRLTLVTSAGPVFAPSDLLRVDAALTSAAQPRPAQLRAGSLPAAEALMAGDSSGLLGVFEWAVLALAAAVAIAWVRGIAGSGPAWLIGLPVLGPVCLRAFDAIATLFPNLL